MGKIKRINVTENVYYESLSSLDSDFTFSSKMELLDKLFPTLPLEEGKIYKYTIDDDSDYYHSASDYYIHITTERPETDEEYEKRVGYIENTRAMEKKYKDMKLQEERLLYEKLKAKFEK